MKMIGDPVTAAAEAVAASRDADVLCYLGGLWDGWDDRILKLTMQSQGCDNVLVVLTTFGGSPHVAYRIGRCLQRRYKRIVVLIHDYCKSAGTLLSLAAHELVMESESHLGPLDMQIQDKEEIGEFSSGLTLTQSLTVLRQEAFTCMKETFEKLRWDTPFQFSSKLAAQVASEMAIGLFKCVYEQLDPMRLGENERAMLIGQLYGERLATDNLKDWALARLIKAYPSHEFVIDGNEAKQLFNSVTSPTEEEIRLLAALDEATATQQGRRLTEPIVRFVAWKGSSTKDTKGPKNDSTKHNKTDSGGKAAAGSVVGQLTASHADDGKSAKANTEEAFGERTPSIAAIS